MAAIKRTNNFINGTHGGEGQPGINRSNDWLLLLKICVGNLLFHFSQVFRGYRGRHLIAYRRD